MGTLANYNGGAQHATLSTTTPRQLVWFQRRVQALNPTVAGASVRMPNVSGRTGLGGPVFIVLNVNGSNSLAVRTFGGATLLGTLTPGTAGLMLLRSATTSAGAWTLVPRVLNSAGMAASRESRSAPEELPATCNPARWVCVKCDDPLVAFYTNDESVGEQVGKVIQIDSTCWRVYSVRNSGRHGISVPSFTPHDYCTDCCIATGGGGGGSTVDLISSSSTGGASDPYENDCERGDGDVDPADQAFDDSFSPPIGGGA